MLNRCLKTLVGGGSLSYEEAALLSSELIVPGHSPAVVGALLAALRLKGEATEEIAGFVTGLRQNAEHYPITVKEVYDVAGTGGDGAHTQNISTLTALVLAGAGVPVAKHGNRSVSSRCGSADVLQTCGVNILASPQNVARQLAEAGICFIYAPNAHPAMKNVMETRRALQMPSIYNVAGPLSNPLDVTGQVVGVFREDLCDTVAQVLIRLGKRCGAVIHGHGGLDEASLSGPNSVVFIAGDRTEHTLIHPEDLGLSQAPVSQLRGGAPEENAAALLRVLGGETGPFRDAALLNSAIALYSFGKAETLRESGQKAAESLDSGNSMKALQRLREVSNSGEVA